MPQKHHTCVCICTYKRPVLLGNVLQRLEEQETGGLFSYSIVIVDNDKLETARETVKIHARQSKIPVSYNIEPEQNIALARNKAIEIAKGDFIGFIDDDEYPGSQWLLNLYMAINRYRAAGILGPVLPHFEKEPPMWVLKGRFFDRPSHTSGQALKWQNTRTGNVLLKSAVFEKERVWFRPEYGSGGEDRDFFRRKIEQGHIFVWCNEAPVYETVPPERWERKVLIKRALLRGKVALNFPQSKPKSIFVSASAITIYVISLPFLLIFSPFFGYNVFMKYLIKTCDHLGKILALLKIKVVKDKYVC